MAAREPLLLDQQISRLETSERLRDLMQTLQVKQEELRVVEQRKTKDKNNEFIKELRKQVNKLEYVIIQTSERIKSLIGHTDDGAKSGEWLPIARDAVVAEAGSSMPRRRIGLVCDAGLGKTTNMAWLHYSLCDRQFRGRLPFLLRLDDGDHFGLLLSTRHKVAADALLDWMTDRVCTATGSGSASPLIVKHALERMRRDGRITLLFDGLDHALSDRNFPAALAGLMDSDQWRHCPMWLAGRPYAFKDDEVWRRVFAGTLIEWTFLQVEPFDEAAVKWYMQRTTHRQWYANFPSKPILHVPRLLKLVCGVVNRAIARSASADPNVFLKELQTPAEVYHQAYFGYASAEYGNMNSQGLLYQGIENSRDARVALIGLDDGRTPSEENIEERIRRTGELLGAIAFHLFDLHGDEEKPEPEVGSVSRDAIKKGLVDRLQAAGWGGLKEYEHDITRLETMNTRHLEFLLFRELNQRHFRFHDRTVQAFFAALWASKFPTDQERMKRWGIQPASEEFWQFAVHMPDPIIEPKQWERLMHIVYTPPPGLSGTKEYVQWTRQMAHDTYSKIKTRCPAIIHQWQASKAISEEVKAGLVHIPSGKCYYGDKSKERQIAAFRLCRTPVTNVMYELFDPGHVEWRWAKSASDNLVPAKHPLVKNRQKGGDDQCPVVNVTFWDAWCFAAWCGCRLPTESEWEHACRAGTRTRWYFGDIESELAKHAWYQENSGLMTNPVGEKPGEKHKHPHKLCDLYGNVWEWCDSLWEPNGSSRVSRGGCWGVTVGGCRSASNRIRSPSDHDWSLGFRLAADATEPQEK